MESELVVISPSKTQKPSASDALIREWLFRFGVEHEKDVAPLLPLWQEAFAGMEATTLEKLFRRAMKTCKFFPKVAEILEPLASMKHTAEPLDAESAWQRVLDLRRVYWSPDLPGGFSRGMPKLSERVQQACRASGVFREHESVESLHTWAHKRFIDSYLAWGELEQDKYLLPDGEVKNLLSDSAQRKALPESREAYEEMRERGLAYAKTVTAQPEPELRRKTFTVRPSLLSVDEQKAKLREMGFLK